ncbi:MAG: CRISPR-associated endonuclease Cas1 [Nitrospirae bacterium CG_4_10_14_0_8_um_filter_41_23]|nr:CRISPR-associated endonuclease Cas1 [Nitrospirota bacterium]OIP59950.1 MAG: CRISPR-associated endonuclease Cas1 [Nitrospirae bacterium CG2_30_41_42]PIQ93042.1 MAG: CRISPR-associated endonuclease Cas1 [Nitrospirae bacterium CG11_big_fil_rev_8_21_14_0_20_41_14]PIV41703.1 MAG: CRISPR-associated endonuclease Cas1 [Nitrospirae bacterium CG02_land_8_20_14_3_00_41_53]PIW87602.1 MAG: CRISPR-associated endonuclease Cas1 [Nitrospirae bacterium CG_4_8_14_3_um_filter_41_47]PIY87632.1 MAG: CRISPR-associ
MGTLYIDRKELHIRLDGQALAFYSNGEREGLVPISPLKRVIVIGNVSIETPVLHKLSNENISVIFLSGKRLRFCGMLHGRLHNNGILRVKQYEKSLSPFSLEIASDIVKRKVSGQSEFLRDVRESRPDLRFPMTNASKTLEKILETLKTQSVEMETLRGLEGGASATYFQAYTKMFPESLKFKKRNRRPPEDPVNAMLSLCYTLLHYEMVREIEVIGLDPTIGFYHQFDYGRESLACDLVELYRTDVDRFVWEIFRERIFAVRDFAHGDERPGCYLKKESRKRFYPLYEEWAKGIRPKLVNKVRTLSVRIMDGQDIISE